MHSLKRAKKAAFTTSSKRPPRFRYTQSLNIPIKSPFSRSWEPSRSSEPCKYFFSDLFFMEIKFFFGKLIFIGKFNFFCKFYFLIKTLCEILNFAYL